MDRKEEELIRFVASQYFDAFKEKYTNLSENDRNNLRKRLLDFSNLEEYSQYILKSLKNEPFYDIFLNKILRTNYANTSESLTSSLIAFFDAIEDLFFWINDTIAECDTPTGPVEVDWAYSELVPKLVMVKGNFNLYHHGICYTPVIKKLSQSLNDGGMLVKTAIYRELSGFVKSSGRTIESLDRETVTELFKERFVQVKNYSGLSTILDKAKKFIATKLIEDFRLKDLFFSFLNKKDAKTILRLDSLVPGGLKFNILDSLEGMCFTDWDVVINDKRQVIGLQLRNVNLKEMRFICKLENLQVLRLVNLEVQELPETIGNLASLRTLDFGTKTFGHSGNAVQLLPKSIGDLKNLENLNLSFNPISDLKELSNLTNLRNLRLEGCQITKIEGLDKLTNLEVLDLGNNQITKIEGLKNLVKLRYLDLSDNQFSEIENLDYQVNLTSLFLGSKKLTRIKGLEKLTNLSRLSIKNSNITEIQGLETLLELHVLDLSNNQITKIKGLETLIMLTNLDLRLNPIYNESDLFKKTVRLMNRDGERLESVYVKSHDRHYIQKIISYCKNIKEQEN